jgi:hypothetical protein
MYEQTLFNQLSLNKILHMILLYMIGTDEKVLFFPWEWMKATKTKLCQIC